MNEYCHRVHETVKEDIINFTEGLPDDWQTQIPEQNLAVDGRTIDYRFNVVDFGSVGTESNVFYYVNKPINSRFFLTIWAQSGENNTIIEILLSEGTDITGLVHLNRDPEFHVIDSERLSEMNSEIDLEPHFEKVSNIVEQFISDYGHRDLGELQTISTYGEVDS